MCPYPWLFTVAVQTQQSPDLSTFDQNLSLTGFSFLIVGLAAVHDRFDCLKTDALEDDGLPWLGALDLFHQHSRIEGR